MTHRGNSSLLEALDTSAEKDDQGYRTLFGFGNIMNSDDSASPGHQPEEAEEDDVVLVEDTPTDSDSEALGSPNKVTKRALDFKGSFNKDYKIPRKMKDSEVVEDSTQALSDNAQYNSSPLSKTQYPPCNTQYTRTQHNRLSLKLVTGKGNFNSYREDQQARVVHSNSNSFNKHNPQNSQKISVHVPALSTVALKPRIVVDNHGVSGIFQTLSQQSASTTIVKHGVNMNSSSTGVSREACGTDVSGGTEGGTGNSTGTDTNVSSNVQTHQQHEKGQLGEREAFNVISSGGLQGGGRGQVVARGGLVRRGRPLSSLKGNATGMNMLSSARVNLGDRCDQTSTNSPQRQGFQDEFSRHLQEKNRNRTAPRVEARTAAMARGETRTAAEEMRQVLGTPSRLGAWKHADVTSSTTVSSATQVNGETSLDAQKEASASESGTEKKEADSTEGGDDEAEEEAKIAFLCMNCGNSTYNPDHCNSCGKNKLQKVNSSHDPLKPRARAPLSRRGIQTSDFYKDKMARFSNIYSPTTSTVTYSRTAADKTMTQQRLYQPATRRNTRNAGRPLGRTRVSQKEVPEVVLISDDEDDPPKPAVQSESSPASQPGSGANTPLPEPENKHGAGQDFKSEADSTQQREASESPVPPKARAFITDQQMSTAVLIVRAIRIGSRLVQPCEAINFSVEKGIHFKVEGHSFELQPEDLVQSVAHFGNSAPFIQLSVTPKVGLAIRSRFRFKKKEGMDWFDPGSSDASEKYILLLLHTPVTQKEADTLRFLLQTFSSHPDRGFIEIRDKEEANNVLLALEVKEPLQKSEKTTFITTQSVLMSSKPPATLQITSSVGQGPSSISHRQSPVPRGPPIVPGGQSDKVRTSQRKTVHEHRMSLSEASSRSSSPLYHHDQEDDDKDGFVGPVTKLMVYPPPPASGGITVTTEDLWCLRDGEFLNDVIIDFYLKYLVNAVLSEEDRKRTHIFSSFFYKRLMQRDHIRTRSEDNMHASPIYRRHSRVKTWTRHVDLFSKDFVIVPINENAHWYLAVVCFPGLDKEDPYPTVVPRLTRPPTPDLDPPSRPSTPHPPTAGSSTRPSTPASNPEQTAQSTEDGGSGLQQSCQSREGAEITSDGAVPSSSQSSSTSLEAQADSDSSQDSSTKGIQTEPLTLEQIEAAFASQLQEETRLGCLQSNRKCQENLEQKLSPRSRRSPRKDSTSQQSTPNKRNSPRKKTEESLKNDSRQSLDSNDVRNSVSTTSPRKKLKFPDAEKERSTEKMDVDQDQREGVNEGERDKMETEQSTAERRKEEMQGEPMETEDGVERSCPETSASAIDTTKQGSHDQTMMDDSASDQSASATSDQSQPAISIRRRPCILLFDSLRGPSRKQHVMKNLREYLTVEWEVRKKDQPKREFDNNNMKGATPKVPQQTNYSDCGVFLLQYAETFFNNPIQDYSFPLNGMEHWFSRQRMKRKRQELQNLIQKLTEEQEKAKAEDKT
ncbi:uncharacterized protein LOC144926108 isoform X2 [Branchiostoma floridae x Branchiostoma belcheri]